MADRHTVIRGSQIRNLTITVDDLSISNSPSEGYILAYRDQSGDLDLSWEPIYVTFVWVLNQKYKVGTTADGIRIAPFDMTILNAEISAVDSGSGSSTIVDINAGNAGSAPSTIFTTQANRPELASGNDWGVGTSGTPDITTITAGQIITCDVDQIATGNASDLIVQLHCEVA